MREETYILSVLFSDKATVTERVLIDIIIIITLIKILIGKGAKNFKSNGLLTFGQVFLVHTFE